MSDILKAIVRAVKSGMTVTFVESGFVDESVYVQVKKRLPRNMGASKSVEISYNALEGDDSVMLQVAIRKVEEAYTECVKCIENNEPIPKAYMYLGDS